MLKDLLPKTVTVQTTQREYEVRYSLNALLCLEMTYKPVEELLKKADTGGVYWSDDETLRVLQAGLCHKPENDRAVSDRRFDLLSPSLAQLGEAVLPDDIPLLRIKLATAVLSAYPDIRGEPSGAADNPHKERDLRTMYVDIMHRPEEEMWQSTYDEIVERSESWLEAKGLKERPVVIQEFDD